MARYGSNEIAFVLLGGYSIAGALSDLEATTEALLEETTTLGDAWVEQSPVGLQRAQLTLRGFYDDAQAGINAALAEQSGARRVLCYGVEGNTIGKRFVGFAGAMQARYVRIATRGELHKARGEFAGAGVVEEGRIVHPLGAETAASGDTTGTPVDDGAASAAGGAAYLQVSGLVLGGYTSATVRIRHSADNITYADLVTFGAVTAAPAAERLVVAGTVQRYLAAAWTFNGTGSGPSITFMAGFHRA